MYFFCACYLPDGNFFNRLKTVIAAGLRLWSRSRETLSPESSNTLWLFPPKIVCVAAFPCTPLPLASIQRHSLTAYLGFALSNAIVLMTFRKTAYHKHGRQRFLCTPLTCSEIDNKLTTTVVKSYVLRWKITTSYKNAIAANGLNTSFRGMI